MISVMTFVISVVDYRSLDGCQGNRSEQFITPFLASDHSSRLHLSWDKIVSDNNYNE